MIYAAFLLLVALGLVTQAAIQSGRIGLTPAAIASYYRGGETGDVMTFPKEFWQLLEVTHAHAFVMAVVFLVLAHLFVSTSLSDRTKAAFLTLAFVGTIGDLLSPWLVRYGAAWCAWIALASWMAQGVGNLALLVLSGRECLARQNQDA
jgi:hypothetical protein